MGLSAINVNKVDLGALIQHPILVATLPLLCRYSAGANSYVIIAAPRYSVAASPR